MEEEEREINEEGIKEKAVEERKKDKSKAFKIIGIIILVFGLIILFLVKYYNEDFPILAIFLIGGGILFISGILMFFNKIQEKFHTLEKLEAKEEKMPKAISKDEARKIAENILKSPIYADYISDVDSEKTEEQGEIPKSTIYCLECKGVYSKSKYFIGINCHYPYNKSAVLIEPTGYEINISKKLLASYPEKTPDIERVVSEDPLTGRKIVTEKTKRHKPSKKKEEGKGEIK